MTGLPLKPFYFLRHGQTDWNLEHRAMGSQDVGLGFIENFPHRHCERSEAIQVNNAGSPRLSPRDDGVRIVMARSAVK